MLYIWSIVKAIKSHIVNILFMKRFSAKLPLFFFLRIFPLILTSSCFARRWPAQNMHNSQFSVKGTPAYHCILLYYYFFYYILYYIHLLAWFSFHPYCLSVAWESLSITNLIVQRLLHCNCCAYDTKEVKLQLYRVGEFGLSEMCWERKRSMC